MNRVFFLSASIVCLFLSSCFGCVAGMNFSYSSDTQLLLGPYTQHVMFNSLTVVWETTTPTINNEVMWGCSPNFGNITGEKNNFPHKFHKVIIEGLTNATDYFYKVVSDSYESETYTFTTLYPSQDPLRFVVYGDDRGEWDNWLNASHVARAIETEHPSFLLNTGDLVDNGYNASDWIHFFQASSYLHNSTLYSVLGNHERYSPLYRLYFPLPHFTLWYSFTNGPVHFIGLDSNTRNAYRPIQLFWLLDDLRTNHQPFTIVFFHHPLYSSGEHGNATFLRKIWEPIFKRYHVDIVFNGHDHDYERSIVNGITYIVTGGGGAPLYDVGHSPWTIFSEKTFHFCLITVNTTALSCEARKPDGTIIDQFTLNKPVN